MMDNLLKVSVLIVCVCVCVCVCVQILLFDKDRDKCIYWIDGQMTKLVKRQSDMKEKETVLR